MSYWKRLRQRVIATLGRLEAVQASEANPLIDGLLRASGQPTLAEGTGRIEFAPARSVGDTWLRPPCGRNWGSARRSGACCAVPILRLTPSACCG